MPRSSWSLIASLTLAACASPGAPVTEHDTQSTLMGSYLMGRYADLTKNPTLAAQNYISALRQEPSDPVLLEGAVGSALVAGDIERAGAAAAMAQARGADSSLGRLTLATLALRTGHYADARVLTQASEGPPFDRLAARVLRAWALAGENKTDLALAALGDAGQSAPFARLFDYQRAMILEHAGRSAEAIKAFESAMPGGLRTPSGIVEYGSLLQRQGKKDAAIALYKQVLADGDEPTIAAALARAQRGEQPPPSVLTKPAGGAAIGMFSLAALLLGQTDADFYMPYLTLALALDPTLDGARLVYAEGLQEMHLWDGSASALDHVPVGSPVYERALVQRVFLLRQQDDQAGAIKLAREAVQRTNGRLARLALADLLRDTEKFSEAEPLYTTLIAESSDTTSQQWRLYFARGACRERMGRWSEAQADLKKALQLSPEQPEVLNYLGYSWIDQGVNLKEGLKMIERAVALEPEAGYIVDSLGWAYFKLGDYPAAVEHLERAVELSPDDAILNDHLGDAYWRDGRRAEARFQWQRSLTLKPSAADKATLEAKLVKGLPAALVKRTARAEEKR